MQYKYVSLHQKKDMINLNEAELQGVLNTLQEIPYKYSSNLIAFFMKKLHESKSKQNEEVVEGQ